MLVARRVTDDSDVAFLRRGLLRLTDVAARLVSNAGGLQYVAMPSSWILRWHPWFEAADIVQLHNIHGGYFSHSALPFLSRWKPMVWRLSDMWPLTGHCVYSYECSRWETGCGSCPYLSEYAPLRWDTTAMLWRWKRYLYANSRLVFVAPSRWMTDLARRSPLVGQAPVYTIPNGVDTEVFQPIDQAEARRALGLPPDGHVLLFCAVDPADRRKGGSFLQEVLRALGRHWLDTMWLATIGRCSQPWAEWFSERTIPLGEIRDDRRLALAYAAADVFVLPSLAENLPNVALESLACGTPVVACDVGGVSEAVRHMETGLLGSADDVQLFARYVERLLRDLPLRRRLGEAGRRLMEREFNVALELQCFGTLYRTLLRLQRDTPESLTVQEASG